jgi:hypothetical protein
MTARTAPAPTARPALPKGAWLKLSAALASQVPAIAGRPDLIVTCAPGAGHGAPACFFPALALIEVDGTHLGVDPASPADRERYRATYARPVASAAWILARAAAAIPAATTATVIYGRTVRPVTWPGRGPARVTEFTATGNYESFCQAVDALDGALGLSRRGAARLLVIVSDGNYKKTEPADGQKRITRLAAAGCGILWLTPDTPSSPMTGARVTTLTDPAATITAIARAATRALAP